MWTYVALTTLKVKIIRNHVARSGSHHSQDSNNLIHVFRYGSHHSQGDNNLNYEVRGGSHHSEYNDNIIRFLTLGTHLPLTPLILYLAVCRG